MAAPSELRTDRVALSERRLLGVLVAGVVVLGVADAVTIARWDDTPTGGWLLLAFERNPSTWFAAALLALTSGTAWLVGRGRPDVARWNAIAAVLLLLSVDEVATIHEKLGQLGLPGVGARAWVGPGLLLVGFTAWRFVPWAAGLDRHLRVTLVAGGALFVAGAVGMEVAAAEWEQGHGRDHLFFVLSSIEEHLEMVGVLVVLRGLLRHLRSTGATVTVSVTR